MNRYKALVSTISVLVLAIVPMMALADVTFPGPPGPIVANNLVLTIFNRIFGFLWPIFFGFAIIMFIVAGFMFILAQGDSSKLKVARDSVLWGSIGVGVGVLSFTLPYIILALFA